VGFGTGSLTTFELIERCEGVIHHGLVRRAEFVLEVAEQLTEASELEFVTHRFFFFQ